MKRFEDSRIKRLANWTSLPCPECNADKSRLEIFSCFVQGAYETGQNLLQSERFVGHPTGFKCRQCKIDEDDDFEDENEFDYTPRENVLPRGIEWTVVDLSQGIFARYRRTIAMQRAEVAGTVGYKYGVDFHVQIHCQKCCCAPSPDKACAKPAGGRFTAAYKSGYKTMWEPWAKSSTGYHLKDPVRHPYPRPKIQMFLIRIYLFIWNRARSIRRGLDDLKFH